VATKPVDRNLKIDTCSKNEARYLARGHCLLPSIAVLSFASVNGCSQRDTQPWQHATGGISTLVMSIS